ncbi:YceI-like domain protein [compost metagenome]
MLGKTAPVTLTASNFNCYDNARMKAHICGGDFETTIKRSQWGMTWGIDKAIPDDVRLLVQIEAIRK